jgi:hypothetical protein
MLLDWKTVTEAEPWLFDDSELDEAVTSVPDKPFRASSQFVDTFPQLSGLLDSARQSRILLTSGIHTLFAWGDPEDGVYAWLCREAPDVIPVNASPDHQVLLSCFGGVVQRFNEPSGNWLLNHNHAFTAAEVTRDASFITAYAWAFEKCVGIPITQSEWYPAAWEFNGNCVLCHRHTGELLFFAPDHADKNLIPFGDCPKFTLHKHCHAAFLREWVERIAEQWADAIQGNSRH